MFWRMMDTYNLMKTIEGPFTSKVVYEKMKFLGFYDEEVKPRYCDHLKRLAKQGYLTRTAGDNGLTRHAIYIYEVTRNE